MKANDSYLRRHWWLAANAESKFIKILKKRERCRQQKKINSFITFFLSYFSFKTALNFHQLKGIQSSILFNQTPAAAASISTSSAAVETNSRKVDESSSSIIIKNSDRSSSSSSSFSSSLRRIEDDQEESKRRRNEKEAANCDLRKIAEEQEEENENNWEKVVNVDNIKRKTEQHQQQQQTHQKFTTKEDSINTSSSTTKNFIEIKSASEKKKHLTMLSNPIENPIHYSREQDLRYTSLSEVSRSISSYAVDTMSSNRLTMPDYDVQSIHPANHRPYDPGSLVNSQTAFERYDPNYLQRTSMYASYSQPSIEELANQQKYLLEHSHHHNTSELKTEPDDSPGTPIYPRPIYQSYDPTGIHLKTDMLLNKSYT